MLELLNVFPSEGMVILRYMQMGRLGDWQKSLT